MRRRFPHALRMCAHPTTSCCHLQQSPPLVGNTRSHSIELSQPSVAAPRSSNGSQTLCSLASHSCTAHKRPRSARSTRVSWLLRVAADTYAARRAVLAPLHFERRLHTISRPDAIGGRRCTWRGVALPALGVTAAVVWQWKGFPVLLDHFVRAMLSRQLEAMAEDRAALTQRYMSLLSICAMIFTHTSWDVKVMTCSMV